ncbi:hydrolase TatD [Prosthecochloris sp. GSB1]|uniref:TatD family hydrolase n=1 Tax=Prosthecochloris sp. GSB1 TaxID=281093 RepID=UPI000B8C7EF3|nr:TatD family hydrolase [Prosthecochloris sp. GSB1]ASQ90875.1 hydrolase TatD [Prosthecochloris sp. GSB1]
MFTDAHCHLSFPEFDNDRAEVIDRMRKSNVSLLIDPGIDIDTSRRSIELSRAHDFIYSTVGLHPHETRHDVSDETFGALEKLADSPEVVGIGEIGLDYHYEPVFAETQQRAFREMLRLAAALDLPAVIHSRDAWDDTLKILKEEKTSNLRGIMHCFSGDIALAEECIRLGFSISVPGTVTYRKSSLPDVVQAIDIEHLLTETDAPYLSPVPFRGKRNEPANVCIVTEHIAGIKGIAVEAAAVRISENTRRIFGLDD